MKIHAIKSGQLVGNRTTFRATSWFSIFRKRIDFEFPVYVYIIEHPEGLIAIDTGMSASGWTLPRLIRRVAPLPLMNKEEEEVGPQMKARGLDPSEVRTVFMTHLDIDHVGGARWFTNATFYAPADEYDFATSFPGKLRCMPRLWPESFVPDLFMLDSGPYGPFAESKTMTAAGDIRAVPLIGHTPGQVGYILEGNQYSCFFSADHFLSQKWFIEDQAKGNLYGLGALNYPGLAEETTHRIRSFTKQFPTVLLPAHDDDAPRRLAEGEIIKWDSQDL